MSSQTQERVICPICKLERWVKSHDFLRLKHIFQIMMTSALAMAVAFPFFHYKVIVIPFCVWTVTEVLRMTLHRQQWTCPQCHYDPFLYQSDPEKARAKCHERLQQLADEKARRQNVDKKVS